MKPIFIFITFFFITGFSFVEQKTKVPEIVIVNIGHLDRTQLGEQLRIINKAEPRVIGLNFLLRLDSLNKDSILISEFSKTKNAVHILRLRDFNEACDCWTNSNRTLPKFVQGAPVGFADLPSNGTDILVSKIQIADKLRKHKVYSFGYHVAALAGTIDPKYLSSTKRVDFKMPKKKPYRIVDVKEIMSEKFDNAVLRDKIVLWGYIGPGKEDLLMVEHLEEKIYGVEMQAYIINALLR